MALPLAIPLAASLIPSGIKLISGLNQKNKANQINPTDPGYQMNTEVIDNARILGDRAGNYVMPGTQQAMNDIQATSANAFNTGIQGATSSGDVLDLATKLSYGTGKKINDLATQNAMGGERALLQYLNAKGAAGQELVNKNAYDRNRYDQKLGEKAALTEAANRNIYGAVDTLASVGASALGNMGRGGNTTSVNQKALQDYLIAQGFDKSLLTTNLGATNGVMA